MEKRGSVRNVLYNVKAAEGMAARLGVKRDTKGTGRGVSPRLQVWSCMARRTGCPELYRPHTCTAGPLRSAVLAPHELLVSRPFGLHTRTAGGAALPSEGCPCRGCGHPARGAGGGGGGGLPSTSGGSSTAGGDCSAVGTGGGLPAGVIGATGTATGGGGSGGGGGDSPGTTGTTAGAKGGGGDGGGRGGGGGRGLGGGTGGGGGGGGGGGLCHVSAPDVTSKGHWKSTSPSGRLIVSFCPSVTYCNARTGPDGWVGESAVERRNRCWACAGSACVQRPACMAKPSSGAYSKLGWMCSTRMAMQRTAPACARAPLPSPRPQNMYGRRGLNTNRMSC